MRHLEPPVLTLFLSHGGSLTQWHAQSILTREMALYLLFLRQGVFKRIVIFSYDCRDRKLLSKLRDDDRLYCQIRVIAPRNRSGQTVLSRIAWSIAGPFRYRSVFRESLAIKTNQISGSWAAILVHFATGRPLVMRFGYILSNRFFKNGKIIRAMVAHCVEWVGYRVAHNILISSQTIADQISNPTNQTKLMINLSYVETSRFPAKTEYDFDQPLVTVARLTDQKNLESLIRACAILNHPLTIYGTGPLESALRKLSVQKKARVCFAMAIPNDELASKLHEHSIFVLPSLHEGLPKALIEAMACGLICAGSNIDGITELIQNEVTGYLIDGFEPRHIVQVLQKILVAPNPQIGINARSAILTRHGIQKYAENEASLYRNLT